VLVIILVSLGAALTLLPGISRSCFNTSAGIAWAAAICEFGRPICPQQVMRGRALFSAPNDAAKFKSQQKQQAHQRLYNK
jgi:hypothetical protein